MTEIGVFWRREEREGDVEAGQPLVVWLRDFDQEPCVYGVGLVGHWHCCFCVLTD